MSDTFNLQEWAERRVVEMTADLKSYIDGGADFEDAIDFVFDGSILAMPYKMRVLEAVGNYRHNHRFVVDTITGNEWCATCQQFK